MQIIRVIKTEVKKYLKGATISDNDSIVVLEVKQENATSISGM